MSRPSATNRATRIADPAAPRPSRKKGGSPERSRAASPGWTRSPIASVVRASSRLPPNISVVPAADRPGAANRAARPYAVRAESRRSTSALGRLEVEGAVPNVADDLRHRGESREVGPPVADKVEERRRWLVATGVARDRDHRERDGGLDATDVVGVRQLADGRLYVLGLRAIGQHRDRDAHRQPEHAHRVRPSGGGVRSTGRLRVHQVLCP